MGVPPDGGIGDTTAMVDAESSMDAGLQYAMVEHGRRASDALDEGSGYKAIRSLIRIIRSSRHF